MLYVLRCYMYPLKGEANNIISNSVETCIVGYVYLFVYYTKGRVLNQHYDDDHFDIKNIIS